MRKTTTTKAAQGRFAQVLVALALTAVVAGCSTGRRDHITTGSVSQARAANPSGNSFTSMSGPQLDAAADSIGKAYVRDPKNKGTALQYANVLQISGRTDQSLAVMRKLAIDYPKDREVLAAYGKALAASGELEPALDAVRRAQTPEYPDWRLLSAEGAILDQLGQPDQARALYRRALDIQPNEASVLSNLGISYLLQRDLQSAEVYLKQAAEAPGADSRVRQNYALVVGLQGRFAEAEQIAARELTREQAQANVAYLRSMLAQNNSWSQIAQEDKKKRG